jgi:hypothetical protein
MHFAKTTKTRSALQTQKLWRLPLLATLALTMGLVWAGPSNYSDITRDPFSRPSAPPKEPGKPAGPTRVGSGGDGPSPKNPVSKTKTPTPSPAHIDPLNALLVLYVEWLKVTYKDVWRPTTLFLADTVKSEAIERATKTFSDMLFTYLSGNGWNVTRAAVLAPKVLSGVFIIYSVMEPSEIGLDPTPKELEEALKALERQHAKEKLPETKKRPPNEVPQNLRNPASEAPPVNVSTEEMRRRILFSDDKLTKEQAFALLSKGAGSLYGSPGQRVTQTVLWLFDTERIEREGLSEEAEQRFDELVEVARELDRLKSRKRFQNACVVAPPNWYGKPARYTCSLPSSPEFKDCFCPPPPGNGPQWVHGFPATMRLGMVCEISATAYCPMIESAPVAGLCGCPGFPGSGGLVR